MSYCVRLCCWEWPTVGGRAVLCCVLARDVVKISLTTWPVAQNLLFTNWSFFLFQHSFYFLAFLHNIVLFHYIIIYVNLINTEISFYQHISLKFMEETSKVIHLEHSFVRCRREDISKRISEIPIKLESGSGEGWSRSVRQIVREAKNYYRQSRKTDISYKQ